MKNFLIGIVIGIVISSIPLAFALGSIFTDVESNSWYEDAVHNLADIGVVEGYEDSTFRPKNNITRAEVAVMFDKYDKYLDSKYKKIYSTYNKDNLSFDYSTEYKVYNADYNENVLIVEDIDGGKIEIYAGDRPFGLSGGYADCVTESNVDIEIKSGLVTYDSDYNELLFDGCHYSVENGIGLIRFQVQPEDEEGQSYDVHIEYTSEEQKKNFLELMKTLEVV